MTSIGNYEEIAQAIQGVRRGRNISVEVESISIDSRKLTKNALFFAIKGEVHDGHDYVEDVLNKALVVVVEKNHKAIASLNSEKHTWIEVDDTLLALQKLALYHRSKFQIPVVAITGSSGKTTTKDMLCAVLGEQMNVHATAGNFNNEIGVPLTLLGLKPKHQVLVVEMGMRGLGQIAELCQMARPSKGLITNIGVTHLELLKTRENIFLAKMELLRALDGQGTCFLNAEDAWTERAKDYCQGQLLTFGLSKEADIWADQIKNTPGGQTFLIKHAGVDQTAYLPYQGKPLLLDALSAVLVAIDLGLPLDVAVRGLQNIKMSQHRMKWFKMADGVSLIDDTYNANPDSVKASLSIFFEQKNRKVAVLGDMLELGQAEDVEHRSVGVYAARGGVDVLIGVGPLGPKIVAGAISENPEILTYLCQDNCQAVDILNEIILSDDTILIKGSRGLHMEDIVKGLLERLDHA